MRKVVPPLKDPHLKERDGKSDWSWMGGTGRTFIQEEGRAQGGLLPGGKETWGLTKQRWEGRRFRQVVIVKSCPTLCDPMDCCPPGSSIHGIFQARILEWVAISFSRRSSRLRDWTWVSGNVSRHFYPLSHQGSWWMDETMGGKDTVKINWRVLIRRGSAMCDTASRDCAQGAERQFYFPVPWHWGSTLQSAGDWIQRWIWSPLLLHPFPFLQFSCSSHVWLFAAPWTAAHQASLSITNSRSLLKLMSIESAMPPKYLCLKMEALEAWELHF